MVSQFKSVFMARIREVNLFLPSSFRRQIFSHIKQGRCSVKNSQRRIMDFSIGVESYKQRAALALQMHDACKIGASDPADFARGHPVFGEIYGLPRHQKRVSLLI